MFKILGRILGRDTVKYLTRHHNIDYTILRIVLVYYKGVVKDMCGSTGG
mgnify:CR=1 FL=1